MSKKWKGKVPGQHEHLPDAISSHSHHSRRISRQHRRVNINTSLLKFPIHRFSLCCTRWWPQARQSSITDGIASILLNNRIHFFKAHFLPNLFFASYNAYPVYLFLCSKIFLYGLRLTRVVRYLVGRNLRIRQGLI